MLHRANMGREMIDIANAPLIHSGSEWEEKRTVGRIRCNVLERGHLLMKRAIRACRIQHVHFREGVAARATHCEGGKERAKELCVDIG